MKKRSYSGVSPVIATVLMIAVSVGLIAFSAMIVFNIELETQEPADVSTNLVVDDGTVRIEIIRNSNVDKFIVTGSAVSSRRTITEETGILTADIPSSGTVTLKGVVDESEHIIRSRTVQSAKRTILGKTRTIFYGDALNTQSGEVTSLASDAQVIGPPTADLTENGTTDLPIVDDDGNLVAVDAEGNKKILVSSDEDNRPKTSKSLMTVGTWKESDTSVLYPDSNGNIVRATNDEKSVVASPGNGVNSVSGISDIDGDGSDEIVFADGSQQLRYANQDGSTEKIESGGVGSNNGIGAGQTVDFDGDGISRVVTVDGSQNIKLVGNSESDITITKANAKKSPPSSNDVDGDGNQEVVYINTNGYLSYVDNPTGSQNIKPLKRDGSKVAGDDKIGVVS